MSHCCSAFLPVWQKTLSFVSLGVFFDSLIRRHGYGGDVVAQVLTLRGRSQGIFIRVI
jgi:hypothetical protein